MREVMKQVVVRHWSTIEYVVGSCVVIAVILRLWG